MNSARILPNSPMTQAFTKPSPRNLCRFLPADVIGPRSPDGLWHRFVASGVARRAGLQYFTPPSHRNHGGPVAEGGRKHWPKRPEKRWIVQSMIGCVLLKICVAACRHFLRPNLCIPTLLFATNYAQHCKARAIKPSVLLDQTNRVRLWHVGKMIGSIEIWHISSDQQSGSGLLEYNCDILLSSVACLAHLLTVSSSWALSLTEGILWSASEFWYFLASSFGIQHLTSLPSLGILCSLLFNNPM